MLGQIQPAACCCIAPSSSEIWTRLFLFGCGGTLAVAIYIILAAGNHCLPTLHGAPRNPPPPQPSQYLPENPAAPPVLPSTTSSSAAPEVIDSRNFPDQRNSGRKRRSIWSKIKKFKRRTPVAAEGSGEGSGEAEDIGAVSDCGSAVSSKWASDSPSAWSSVSQRKFLQLFASFKIYFKSRASIPSPLPSTWTRLESNFDERRLPTVDDVTSTIPESIDSRKFLSCLSTRPKVIISTKTLTK
jgi:hypothetical protein